MTPAPDFGWSLPPGTSLRDIERHYDAGLRVCAGCGRHFHINPNTEDVDPDGLCLHCITRAEEDIENYET